MLNITHDYNKTNPTYTFFLTITTFSSLYRSFCIPYCFPLLSHDISSCQHRSYSCDTNSITNTSILTPRHTLCFYSHSTTYSLHLHSLLSTSILTPRHTLYFYSHSTTYSLLLHSLLSTSIPTPRHTLYFYFHSTTHSLLLFPLHDILSTSYFS